MSDKRIFEFLQNLGEIAKQAFSSIDLNASYPPNWSRLIDLDIAKQILYKDGIPIMWVPRNEIVEELFRESEREKRLEVLINNQSLIISDCEQVLRECTHSGLSDQFTLALKACTAFEHHPEAAQALAVNLADTIIKKFPKKILPSKVYKDVKEKAYQDLNALPFNQVKTWFALAPIYVFFTEYFPDRNHSIPEELSRHVSSHMVNKNHFHRENSIVAIMLMASLMRTMQDILQKMDISNNNQSHSQ